MVNLGPDNSDLPQVNLKIEKDVKINDIDIPLLTDGKTRYFAVLDLCDVALSFYPRELHLTSVDEKVGPKMAVGRIGSDNGSLREVYVIPAKLVYYWFFTLSTGGVKRHKTALRCMDDWFYIHKKLK